MVNLCERCGQPFPKGAWPFCDDGSGKHGHTRSRGGFSLGAHPAERAVVHRNIATGKLSFPPRNDQPTPAGYVREELPTLRDIARVESESGTQSEVAWFDKGTGHAEYMPDHKPIDLTGLEFGVKEWNG